MAAHSRALARKIPLTEEPGGLQSMGSQVLDMTEVTEHAHVACRILVPWPATRPVPPEVEAWSPNLWTTREVLCWALKGVLMHRLLSRKIIPIYLSMCSREKACLCS